MPPEAHLQTFDLDELLSAVNDLEEAVVVIVSDVAGVQPALCVNGLCGGGGVVVVAGHHLRRREFRSANRIV